MPIYLDDNGNEITPSATSGKVYLDDEGNPIESGSSTSRFASGAWRNLNPATIISGIAQAVAHPVDTYNALVDQSAENFTEARRLWNAGEPGHALFHGAAGVVPPLNIVTHAADEMRKGNVAGAIGEATGAGLLPKVPGVVKTGVPATLRGIEKSGAAVANVAAKYPTTTTVIGGGVGLATGGVPGMLAGLTGGGVVSKGIRILEGFEKASDALRKQATSEVSKNASLATTAAKAMNRRVTDRQGLRDLVDGGVSPTTRATMNARSMPPSPSHTVVTKQRISAEEFSKLQQMDPVDRALVNEILARAQPAPTPTAPFKTSKVDIARITALDKELGAANTARALRHDPRLKSMTATERTNAIRTISTEAPHTLPANAARIIDEKFSAVLPAEQAAYIESWKDVNAAVYSYLKSKVTQ